MPKVSLKHPKESFESLFRRFRKAVDMSEVLKTLREREFYEKPSIARKRAKSLAKKRWDKKRKELDQKKF